jgi:ketosteroid isomerase-like protein
MPALHSSAANENELSGEFTLSIQVAQMTGPVAEAGQRRTTRHPVVALESERCRALERSDLDALLKIFSETLTYVHSNGAVHDRATLLEHLRDDVRFSLIERSGLTVEHWGSVAICTGLMRLRGHRVSDNQNFFATTFVTQTWTNHGTGWRLTLMQSTKVAGAMWPAIDINENGNH